MDSNSVNYYDILGVTTEATEKEILKAYRKKALQCHPDKNLDNPKAAQLFIELSEALNILTDEAARAAFDKVLKAKQAAKLRTQAFDAKRKKFKDELERRETAAQQEKDNIVLDAQKLAAEIKRLREEGSKLLKEQQILIQKQLQEELARQRKVDVTPKLKITWKAGKHNHENGGYTDEVLRRILSPYGPLTAVLLSRRKAGMAIVEFQKATHAALALEFEKGLPENRFTSITWLEGAASLPTQEQESTPGSPKDSQQRDDSAPAEPFLADFESLVLQRMRQAEERRRLAQQILQEDSASEKPSDRSIT